MWRQDKALRFLEAQLLVADAQTTLTVSGNGDVLEPQDGVMGEEVLWYTTGVHADGGRSSATYSQPSQSERDSQKCSWARH
jgi:ATP-dependent protease HslVU (ClpYQ) peptidase subunit